MLLLWMILKETFLQGVGGAAAATLIAFGMAALIENLAGARAVWELEIFTRAITISLLLGFIGGIYPAFRATRLEPVEALRYE